MLNRIPRVYTINVRCISMTEKILGQAVPPNSPRWIDTAHFLSYIHRNTGLAEDMYSMQNTLHINFFGVQNLTHQKFLISQKFLRDKNPTINLAKVTFFNPQKTYRKINFEISDRLMCHWKAECKLLPLKIPRILTT